jgi:hypothetical protein
MIVPFTKSNPALLENLRKQAEGNYLSASYPGVYRVPVAGVAMPQLRKLKGGN